MSIKKFYKVFFAIPFDSATKEMYSRIAKKLEKLDITSVIGTREVTPSPSEWDIASFKAQNKDMISEMQNYIENADIIVADMTHNNPNVHFELGIALYLNKNILKVTGRSLGELGFDVRGLEVHQYRTEEKLLEKVTNYIEMYKYVKNLPLSSESGSLYQKYKSDLTIDAGTSGIPAFERLPEFRMKDGYVKAVVKPNSFTTRKDWFGIYFRFEDIPWVGGGYLVYVRKNGSVEIASYPGQAILKKEKLIHQEIENGDEKILEVEIEENAVRVIIDERDLLCKGLHNQNQGNVAIAAYMSNITFKTAEVVCRDTLNF